MSDPVNPTDPPRRIADENIVRKRATDPRLRLGAVGSDAAAGGPPPPLPPPPLVVTPEPAPSLLGLPGQAAPVVPDFDAPTVAQEIPVGGLALQIETTRPAPPGSGGFDGDLATLVSPPPSMPPAPPVVTARATVAPPPPPDVGDGLDFGGGAPAIRPAIEAPEFTHGGRPRPVRERRPTAPAMPVPAVDTEASSSGRVRPPVALDPPVEPSTPRARPVALDPPVEPSTPRPRPGALDPPVEPSSGRVPRPGADPPPGRITSRADAEPGAVADAASATGPQPKALPVAIFAAAAAVVVVLLVVFSGGGSGDHRYSRADERHLADLWLDGGTRAWGGTRQDAVARAVETVGAAVARPMASHLDGRSPRFVVVNDESTAQVFTLPDATIVVTTAALRRLGSEAQLAALLAHSLAHVALGDVAMALDRAGDAEAAVRQSLAGGAPKAAIDLVATVATQPQSAPREVEADAIALEALVASGHAPSALADVIRNFGIRGGRRRAAWLSVHVDDPARLAAIEKAPGGGRTGETEYATRILDHIGRVGPAAPASDTPAPTEPPGEKKSSLRTLPSRPPGPPPTTPAPPVARPAPPDEAPPSQ